MSLPLLYAQVVQPVLEATTERTHESSSVAVLDRMDSVFVARATARRSLSDGLSMGSRLPAYCSATGRALLAQMPDDEVELALRQIPLRKLTPHTCTDIPTLMGILRQTRAKGYAVCDQELELGVRSIAVPLRDSSDRVVAAMSLVAANSRMSVDAMVEVLLPHLESARRMLIHVC